LRLLGIRVIFE